MIKKEVAVKKTDIKEMYDKVEKILGVKIDRRYTSPESILRLVKKLDTGRTTVGSRNPYAAVEHELGIKINWAKSDPPAVEKLLTKAGKESLYTGIRKKLQRGKVS